MIKYLNTIILFIIAIGIIVIIFFLAKSHQEKSSSAPQWEYKCTEILGVPENFESWNSWIKEGWEPVMKMEGRREYLMRRPKR